MRLHWHVIIADYNRVSIYIMNHERYWKFGEKKKMKNVIEHYCSCQLDSVLQQVEWVTLLFFGAMFITMECLARLGLIKWIGKQTEGLILLVDEQMRLALAIIIILWVNRSLSPILKQTFTF